MIGKIRREYNPLKENFKNKPIAVKEVLPNLSPENAFDLGNDEIDEIPF